MENSPPIQPIAKSGGVTKGDRAFKGEWIWKLNMLPKIITFLWLCHHNNIPVRDVLDFRGINCNNSCPMCNSHAKKLFMC